MKTIIKGYYPEYSQEEIDETIEQYKACNETMCSDCENVVSSEELEDIDTCGDGDITPFETIYKCPHCGCVSPDLVKVSLEVYLQNEL